MLVHRDGAMIDIRPLDKATWNCFIIAKLYCFLLEKPSFVIAPGTVAMKADVLNSI